MIIIKNKLEKSDIALIKDYGDYSGNYSIVLQHTLTKNISVFQTVEDVGNKYNYIFEDVHTSGLEDGEYYMVLLENPDNLPIITNPNNPQKVVGETIEYIYLTNAGDFITNAGFYLVIQGKERVEKELKPVCTELMRIGEYKSPKTQYNSTKQYIQYGK
jgi:hypothetical protein